MSRVGSTAPRFRMTADRAGRALVRALGPQLGAHRLLAISSRDWASLLFEGARHRLAVTLEGRDAAARAGALQATLGEAELDFPGGFVADIVVVARLEGAAPVLAIEALTIEDPECRPADTVSRAGRRAG
jgi:hypothetical protein